MSDSVRFYFDFISPYAYLGWKQIHGLAHKHGLAVAPIPVLFSAMLKAYGHKGPAEIPPKRLYTWKHLQRLAFDRNVTIVPPPAHPFNPLLGLRIASLPGSTSDQMTVIDVLYTMTWTDGTGITDPARVADALARAGLPGPELVEQAGTPESKARVRVETDAAIAAGVFGVPTVHVRGEQFWGQDAFGHIDRFLEGNDPIEPASLERWADLPASAHRKPG